LGVLGDKTQLPAHPVVPDIPGKNFIIINCTRGRGVQSDKKLNQRGLSATPKRKNNDEKLIYVYIGNILHALNQYDYLKEKNIRTEINIKENSVITNKIYQELFKVSKATATRDLTNLVDKFKLLERHGEKGAGTTYKLIGS
jgi:predicted HTH transcriptional regulator